MIQLSKCISCLVVTGFSMSLFATVHPPHRGAERGERPSTSDLIQKLDVNQDNVISQDEAKGPLANHFDQMDSNQDGVLTLSEIEQGKSTVRTSRRRRSRRNQQVDSEDNNTQQATQYGRRRSNRGSNQDQQQGQRERPSAQQLMQIMDANSDQMLSQSEVRGPLQKHFDKVDVNQDGVLSIDELEQVSSLRSENRRERTHFRRQRRGSGNTIEEML